MRTHGLKARRRRAVADSAIAVSKRILVARRGLEALAASLFGDAGIPGVSIFPAGTGDCYEYLARTAVIVMMEDRL